MRVIVTPATGGRLVWRLWDRGRVLTQGTADTRDDAELAALVWQERQKILAERRVERSLKRDRADLAERRMRYEDVHVVPPWLRPAGGGDE